MKLETSKIPLALVFTAHADDAEFFAGGTLARFVSEGYRVVEVIATDNSRGSYELDSAALVERSRRVEAAEAARVIGKEEVLFLEYPDGFLAETPLSVLREKYIRFIRKYRPTVVFTFDPWAPLEPHPDHRHVAMAATEAVFFANLPLFHPEHRGEGLGPHLVPERYFFAKAPDRADKVVDVSNFIERKVDALCAHESQMKLTIDDLKLSIEATGRFKEALPFLDRNNYRPAIDMFMRQWARNVGRKAGFEYGEEFRFDHAAGVLDFVGG